MGEVGYTFFSFFGHFLAPFLASFPLKTFQIAPLSCNFAGHTAALSFYQKIICFQEKTRFLMIFGPILAYF